MGEAPIILPVLSECLQESCNDVLIVWACKVLGKNPERWLCYVLTNIKKTPKDKLYTLLPEFLEDKDQQK